MEAGNGAANAATEASSISSAASIFNRPKLEPNKLDPTELIPIGFAATVFTATESPLDSSGAGIFTSDEYQLFTGMGANFASVETGTTGMKAGSSSGGSITSGRVGSGASTGR